MAAGGEGPQAAGFEYSWGKSKQFFRRHTNHKHLRLSQNIAKSIDKNNLPLARVRKYARKTRAYVAEQV